LTGERGQVAGLYTYAQLDPLIDLACLVARDFFARPQLYTSLEDSGMPDRLARLQSRVGSSEYYPSREQRHAMYDPVFGTSDFERLRDGLLASATAFAEWSQATGIPMLRERVRTEHRPFRQYLTGLSGAAVDWSRNKALPALADDEAYPVLRDRGVIAVFGLTDPPQADWPFVEDSNGDKSVEQISKHLVSSADKRLTRESFSALQRVALRGAEALSAVMTLDAGMDDAQLDELITSCYTWHAALKAWAQSSVMAPRGGNA
jgi:hypothetical protein